MACLRDTSKCFGVSFAPKEGNFKYLHLTETEKAGD